MPGEPDPYDIPRSTIEATLRAADLPERQIAMMIIAMTITDLEDVEATRGPCLSCSQPTTDPDIVILRRDVAAAMGKPRQMAAVVIRLCTPCYARLGRAAIEALFIEDYRKKGTL